MTQDTRLIRLSGSFIDDSCVAMSLQGHEALSTPFEFTVTFLTENLELTCEDVVGQKIGIALYPEARPDPIYRHGRVNRMVLQDVDESGVRFYQINVVPGLWFLSQSGSNRIFENQTSLDIVQEIIAGYGAFCELEVKTNGQYLAREYCVQFHESDLAFVERLLAEDGINYYFTHSDRGHTLVLCDQANGFTDCQQYKVIKRGLARQDGTEGAAIFQWQRTLSYHPMGYLLQDYNQDTPKNFYRQQVTTTSAFAQTPAVNTVEGYGCYNFKTNAGSCHDFDAAYNKQLTRNRMEAEESRHDMAMGSGNCASFLPGGRFDLQHNATSENGTYLIWEISHQANNNIDSPSRYENQFHCVPAEAPVRPRQPDFKRRMPGPQMAKVISLCASGSAADADPQRMIKARFPWDGDHNTCKLRVLQSYAGSGWGASFVPREGQEVLVDFINGDADRPLVVGALYNKDNTGPKYTATQSGWLTQSSNANELRFDDAGGAEEIYLKAGKDMNFLIANNETGQVQNDQALTVDNNRSISVGANESKSVAGNQDETITGNQTLAVQSNRALTVGQNQSSTVSINDSETIGAAKELTIGGLYQVTVGAAMNETVAALKAEEVGANKTVLVAKNMSENVGDNRTLSVGKTSTHSAKKITISAEDELTIKVGKASLTMKKDGTIALSGKDIQLKGSGKINIKASSDVAIKGSKTGIN
ncbi:MAG: hypothetical protein CML06_00680 [Pseudomonadales bacterium]|nr:hypothetical protein [Pseudomonadales bacterium]